MKRSERIYQHGRTALMQALVAWSFAACLSTWAVAAYLDNPFFGLVTFIAAFCVAAIATGLSSEGFRLIRLSFDEERHEYRRAVRPRL